MANPITDAVKHSLLRTLSVVCVLAVVIGIGWAIYAGIIRPVTKPNPTTTQQAENISNTTINYPERRGFINLDCLWGWVRISLGPQKEIKK